MLFQKGEVFMPGKVRVIPANANEPMKHVVIYAVLVPIPWNS